LLNNPVGKKLAKQFPAQVKFLKKVQKTTDFLSKSVFLVVAGERNIVYQQLFESVLIYHAAFVR